MPRPNAGGDDRRRQPLLVQVQPRRDERPSLVEHIGQRDQEGDEQGQLQRHHERRDHPGGDQLGAFRQHAHQRRRQDLEDVAHERRQGQEDHHDGDRRANQPLAQLDQVRQEALLFAGLGAARRGRSAHRPLGPVSGGSAAG
jgi:hypothetical protein